MPAGLDRADGPTARSEGYIAAVASPHHDFQLGDGTTTDSHTPAGVIGFGGSLVCGVPYVLGEPLAKARAEIVRAHCRVGTIKRVASRNKKNTVVGESPRAGTRLKKGAKVNLKISRGPLEPRR
jgi:PASTA domain